MPATDGDGPKDWSGFVGDEEGPGDSPGVGDGVGATTDPCDPPGDGSDGDPDTPGVRVAGGDGAMLDAGRNAETSTGGKGTTSIPRVATDMKACQISAGVEPPVTPAIGRFALG